MVYFSCVIWWFCFPDVYAVSGFLSRIFPDFQEIFRFLHIIDSLLLLCDMMIVFYGIRLPDFHEIFRFCNRINGYGFGKIIRFLDFFRIFTDFNEIFRFLHTIDCLLLLCDMMIIFSGYISCFCFFQILMKSSDFLKESMDLFLGK